MSAMKLGHGPQIEQGQAIRQAQNVELRNGLLEARLDSDSEDEEERQVEPEAPEPPELEDRGDIAAHGEEGEPVGSIFDRTWTGDLPLITRLPHRLRPPVRYRIDADLVVLRFEGTRLAFDS
jgi:hypothetical protein